MLVGRAIVDNHARYGEIVGECFFPVDRAPFDGAPVRSGPKLQVSELHLLSPVAPRVVLLMVNAFSVEGHSLPPDEVPWMTPKMTSHIGGQDADVVVPSFATKDLIAEAEMAVVIKSEIHRASAEEARQAIFGYTVFNDMTAGTIKPDMDMFRCKSIEGFASMGPWICTDIEESAVEAGLQITARVADDIRVKGSTRDYKFPVHEVIRFASMHTRLHPGDVISLGTPAACYVDRGDNVTLAVEGIGELRNRIVDE